MITHHPIDLETHRQARKIIAPVCNFSQSEPSNFLVGAKNTVKFTFLSIYIVKEFLCKKAFVLFLYHGTLWFWASFAPIAKFSKKITQKFDFLAHFKRCTWTKWTQDKDNTSSLLAVIESILTWFHFYIFGWKVENFGVFFGKSDMRKDALFNFNLKFQTYFSFYSAFSNEKKELWVHTFTQENNRSHIYSSFEYFFTFFLWDNSQSLTLTFFWKNRSKKSWSLQLQFQISNWIFIE